MISVIVGNGHCVLANPDLGLAELGPSRKQSEGFASFPALRGFTAGKMLVANQIPFVRLIEDHFTEQNAMTPMLL